MIPALLLVAAVTRPLTFTCPEPAACPPCPQTCQEIDYDKLSKATAMSLEKLAPCPPPPVTPTDGAPRGALPGSVSGDMFHVRLSNPPVGSDLLALEEGAEVDWSPRSWRFWLSAVGAVAFGMIVQHQLEDDDGDSSGNTKTIVIHDPGDPNTPCHPPGHCRGD